MISQPAIAFWNRLDARDRRAVTIGIVGVLIVMLYVFAILPLLTDWSAARSALHSYGSDLDRLAGATPGSRARLKGLYTAVPFVESPQDSDQQRKTFWDAVNGSLKSSGLAISSPPRYLSASAGSPADTLSLAFAGKGTYQQLLKFFAAFHENPHGLSVEDFTLKRDDKNPEQLDMTMTVSTFIRQEVR